VVIYGYAEGGETIFYHDPYVGAEQHASWAPPPAMMGTRVLTRGGGRRRTRWTKGIP
jgi:hypothetical protein